jgi:hypothetical protein
MLFPNPVVDVHNGIKLVDPDPVTPLIVHDLSADKSYDVPLIVNVLALVTGVYPKAVVTLPDVNDNVPPKVSDPVVVTVPVSVNPLTVPVPLTDVTPVLADVKMLPLESNPKYPAMVPVNAVADVYAGAFNRPVTWPFI